MCSLVFMMFYCFHVFAENMCILGYTQTTGSYDICTYSMLLNTTQEFPRWLQLGQVGVQDHEFGSQSFPIDVILSVHLWFKWCLSITSRDMKGAVLCNHSPLKPSKAHAEEGLHFPCLLRTCFPLLPKDRIWGPKVAISLHLCLEYFLSKKQESRKYSALT